MTDQPPESNQPAAAEDTVTISRSTLYYIATAVLFFIGGYIVAWAVFAATTGNVISSSQFSMETAVSASMATSIGQLSSSSVASGTATNRAVALPVVLTPRAVPIQNVSMVNAPYWGTTDAKVTVIEYGDFQCPYCEAFFQETYPQLKRVYSSLIRYEFRNFPSRAHPDAFPAALAAECANEQGKFWEYHDLLYQNQQDLSVDGLTRYATLLNLNVANFSDCFHSERYADVVNRDFQDAIKYQAAGTPTFYINGQFVQGAQAYVTLANMINSQLLLTGEVQVF
jgi:protein-disulfide isomerase